MNEAAAHKQVRSRRVFYIPGYDPIHPRRYRELYRSEGAAQAELSGYALHLTPKSRKGRYGWHVDAEIEGATVAADVEVLVWSDLVRESMDASIPGTYLQLVRTAWTYVASGTLRRLMWLRKGPVIAALYPVAMLILQLFVALLALWLVASLVGEMVGWVEAQIWPGRIFTPLFYPSIVLALAAGAAAMVLLLRLFKSRDGKLFAYYLMHDYAYTARLKGANPPELERRMAAFGKAIAAALASDVDEVLVVGHSSGAHLAVSILADLLRAGKVPANGPALGFLSLGQVIPMISFLPEAKRLRADLHYLAGRDELFWLDVTAPGDGCAFALCDPVAVTGVAPPGQKGPLVISAAFSRTLSPERWKALRWRFFRLHFQYLCAFDNLPGTAQDYDYFRVTAGPQTLAARFAGRAPSASRIDVPASRHTARLPARDMASRRHPARQSGDAA
ncbi:hypothetical protein [Frigidibacter sp. ROC022]|uniref:hypothetical protein n=1 Tax=Frigidibacter sp. ROC022 TaxID=2971796 RepID=UPI00215ABD9F|nr:hypothetical protein [Frigidibacter sp. ROC022]MCR8723943.1 hypothetical protein [Frigidibacter sp. ROC022]